MSEGQHIRGWWSDSNSCKETCEWPRKFKMQYLPSLWTLHEINAFWVCKVWNKGQSTSSSLNAFAMTLWFSFGFNSLLSLIYALLISGKTYALLATPAFTQPTACRWVSHLNTFSIGDMQIIGKSPLHPWKCSACRELFWTKLNLGVEF